jgi:hypothetical protein
MAIAMNLANAQPTQAEPLTPLQPNEIQYLDKLRKVLTASHDNATSRSNGELLDTGRAVCQKRSIGIIGQESTLVSPAITQLAFIYLCPN